MDWTACYEECWHPHNGLIVEEILCCNSAPWALLPNHGKSYLSEVLKGVCKLVDTAEDNTTSYHHECDSSVENFNHTFTTSTSRYVSEHQKDCDHFISYAFFAYGTTVQRRHHFISCMKEILISLSMLLYWKIKKNMKTPRMIYML